MDDADRLGPLVRRRAVHDPARSLATTASDQNAAPFLKAQFDKLSSLSDKYLGMAASLSFIDRNSLNNDSLDRSIMACNRSLSSMATANQFVDDGTCH